MSRLAFLAIALIATSALPAQSAARPAILIVGTYHMANPGRDVANMEADDVFSARRQSEMTQLIEVLRKFRPTRIAVEASITSSRVPRDYAAYRAGTYTLTRNEVDQIGYRLAKELGHETVYPVDADGDFPYYRVRNYARANERMAEFDSLEAGIRAAVKEQADYLRSHTILETLLYMNADSTTARAVASYYEYVPLGEPWEYAGPDLVADWFRRNIRIYRNIVALVGSPDERVLVVYGAGHLGWLRQMAASDARVQLRTLAEVVRQR
jgi:hypothetical protein